MTHWHLLNDGPSRAKRRKWKREEEALAAFEEIGMSPASAGVPTDREPHEHEYDLMEAEYPPHYSEDGRVP